jgi:hypothetical protein
MIVFDFCVTELRATVMNTSSVNQRPQLSPKDFAAFGVDLVAYVKPVTVDGTPSYGIYAADGTELSVVVGRAAAFATVRRHEMEPLSVH